MSRGGPASFFSDRFRGHPDCSSIGTAQPHKEGVFRRSGCCLTNLSLRPIGRPQKARVLRRAGCLPPGRISSQGTQRSAERTPPCAMPVAAKAARACLVTWWRDLRRRHAPADVEHCTCGLPLPCSRDRARGAGPGLPRVLFPPDPPAHSAHPSQAGHTSSASASHRCCPRWIARHHWLSDLDSPCSLDFPAPLAT